MYKASIEFEADFKDDNRAQETMAKIVEVIERHDPSIISTQVVLYKDGQVLARISRTEIPRKSDPLPESAAHQ